MPYFSITGSLGSKSRRFFAALFVIALVSLSFYARAQTAEVTTQEELSAAQVHGDPSSGQKDKQTLQAVQEQELQTTAESEDFTAQERSESSESENEEGVLVLTLRPGGFEPEEITIPQGDYLVVLTNRTGLDDIGLRLDKESAGRVHEMRLRRRLERWKHRLNLPAGTYILTETSRPEWSCRINVTAR